MILPLNTIDLVLLSAVQRAGVDCDAAALIRRLRDTLDNVTAKQMRDGMRRLSDGGMIVRRPQGNSYLCTITQTGRNRLNSAQRLL